MTLAEWLEAEQRGSISELSRRSGVSMLTIRRVRDGMRLRNVVIARRISEATGGVVSAQSMLELERPKSDSVPPAA